MQLLFHTYSIAKHWYVFEANTDSVISVSEKQYKALSDFEVTYYANLSTN